MARASFSSPVRHANRVMAVIAAHRPGQELLDHVARLLPQVSRVLVVDDGSGAEFDDLFAEIAAMGCQVHRNANNSGIGASINRGFAAATEAGAEFIVTFDQDSAVSEGFIDALVDEFDRAVASGLRVAIVAPSHYGQTAQYAVPAGVNFLNAEAPIQSGSLLPLTAVGELGPQREDFFIDLIDTEYYFRSISLGFDAVAVPGLVLEHGFGHRLYVHAFGRRLSKPDGRPRMVAVSSPFRYYYRARNRVLLNREFADNRGIRRTLRAQGRRDLLLDFAVALYSARGRLALLRIMAAGRRDGRRGLTGKMPEHLDALARRVSWRHPVDDPPVERPSVELPPGSA